MVEGKGGRRVSARQLQRQKEEEEKKVQAEKAREAKRKARQESHSQDGGDANNKSTNALLALQQRLGQSWAQREIALFYEGYKSSANDVSSIAARFPKRPVEQVQAFYEAFSDHLDRATGDNASVSAFVQHVKDWNTSVYALQVTQSGRKGKRGRPTASSGKGRGVAGSKASGASGKRKQTGTGSTQSSPAGSPSKGKKKKRRVDSASHQLDPEAATEALLGLQTPSPHRQPARRAAPNQAGPSSAGAGDGLFGSLLNAAVSQAPIHSVPARFRRKNERPPRPTSNPYGIMSSAVTSSSKAGRRSGLPPQPSSVAAAVRASSESRGSSGVNGHGHHLSGGGRGGSGAHDVREPRIDPSDIPASMSEETYRELYQRTLHSLTPKHRQWAMCEWFYPCIDQEYFNKSGFQEEMVNLGIEHVDRLTRTEWSYVRSLMGKTRRFSRRFIEEERRLLRHNRDVIRYRHATTRGQGAGSDVGGNASGGQPETTPADGKGKGEGKDSTSNTEEGSSAPGATATSTTTTTTAAAKETSAPNGPYIPPALTVGRPVMARHPDTKVIHRGSILTVDSQRHDARIQFDDSLLGTSLVPDVDIMMISADAPASLRGAKTPSAHGTPAAVPAVTAAETLQSTGYSRADILAISNLRHLLQRKDATLDMLRTMNEEAERLAVLGNGFPDLFRRQYAWLVVQIDATNRALKPALVRVRAIPRISAVLPEPADPAASTTATGTVTGKADAAPVTTLGKAVVDSSAATTAGTTTTSAGTTSTTSTAKGGEEQKKVDTAVPGMDKSGNTAPVPAGKKSIAPSAVAEQLGEQCRKTAKMMVTSLANKIQEEQQAERAHNGTASWKAEDVIQATELVQACISLLLHIQSSSERVLSPDEVSWCLDEAVNALTPHHESNRGVYNEIRASVGVIKDAIRATMSV